MNARHLAASSLFVLVAACGGSPDGTEDTTAADLSHQNVKVTRTDLVSDQAGAHTLDTNVVNAWGISFNPAGPAWVSNNGTGTTTVYDATGKLLLTVDIAKAPSQTEVSPTGQVFNPTTGFHGDKFIIADEKGSIAGWQPNGGAVTRVDSTAAGAAYKGLAIAGDHILAADFHNGKVDVFDSSYAPVSHAGFVDATLPAGYAPYNVQTLDGKVYIAYAKQDAERHDDVAGVGNGYVDVFEQSGVLIGRVASRGSLNAPWALAIAPASFGAFAGKLLVGNFGDGQVQAFDVAFQSSGGGYGSTKATTVHARALGHLLGSSGKTLVVDGLWALATSPQGELWFSAGPAGESHGVLGKLLP